jgi:hypothetical protein
LLGVRGRATLTSYSPISWASVSRCTGAAPNLSSMALARR